MIALVKSKYFTQRLQSLLINILTGVNIFSVTNRESFVSDNLTNFDTPYDKILLYLVVVLLGCEFREY